MSTRRSKYLLDVQWQKIALLDVKQNFCWMSSRAFTRRQVDQMIWAIMYVRLDQYERTMSNVYLVKNFIPEWLILDSFFKVLCYMYILISIQTKGPSIVYYEQRSAISLVFYERYYIEAQQHTILSIQLASGMIFT